MITLTRLNGTPIAVNPFQIELMEETPDTIILMNSGRKMVVLEKIPEIRNKFAGFLGESVSTGILRSRGVQ